jgi:superfamily I DNA and RNA helicase
LDLGAKVKLYIFQDGNQAIYTSTDELPINTEPLFLFDNCRNTKPIHQLAYQYYQGEEIEAPKIDGEPIQYIIKDSLEKQAFEIDKRIAELIHKEKIKPKDIVVVVMDNFNIAQGLLEKTKNNKIWAFKEFTSQSKVLVETAKRFKGLESKIIFLWILDSSNMTEKMLYISISRARFRLWIIGDTGIKRINSGMPFSSQNS